jgi:hypothetical protein
VQTLHRPPLLGVQPLEDDLARHPTHPSPESRRSQPDVVCTATDRAPFRVRRLNGAQASSGLLTGDGARAPLLSLDAVRVLRREPDD